MIAHRQNDSTYSQLVTVCLNHARDASHPNRYRVNRRDVRQCTSSTEDRHIRRPDIDRHRIFLRLHERMFVIRFLKI
jgi:hypothetical protein